MQSLRPVKRNTAPTQVVEALIQSIRNREFGATQRLPVEHELCSRLSVGRNSLREAIRFLEMAGVLEVRPGDGTYIVSDDTLMLGNILSLQMRLTPASALQIIESRRVVESAVAGFAAERATAAERAQLREALDRMRSAETPELFGVADVDFHLILAQASHNAVLRHMILALRSGMSEWIQLVLLLPDSRVVALEDHVRIFEAIMQRDGPGSRAAMDVHLSAVGRRLLQVMTVEQIAGADGLGGEPEEAAPARPS